MVFTPFNVFAGGNIAKSTANIILSFTHVMTRFVGLTYGFRQNGVLSSHFFMIYIDSVVKTVSDSKTVGHHLLREVGIGDKIKISMRNVV